MRAAMPRY